MFSLERQATLAALIGLTTMIAGCGHSPRTASDPRSAANAFFLALEKGDAHTAYNSAAFGFQAGQTFDAFLSNARELGLVGGQPPAWTHQDIQGTEAHLDGNVVSQTGSPIAVSVTLTQDEKQWKLFSLHTAMGGTAENRFTLVGKGTGFNDVYHQPIPNQQKLVDLVHDTLGRFNTAIRTEDFHDFYGWISQQWRDGQQAFAPAGPREPDFEHITADTRVTEKLLKEHFQAFIDKKIDLSAVASEQPVFDRPPLINTDGYLDLEGHFDTPQFRVSFELMYAYELPRWKLFGLNLNLTK
jgi:hypothetical protein